MKFKFSLLYWVAILVMFGGFALKANAASPNDILVNVAPPSPAPYENVSINLKSFAFNLDSVLISWSIDGKTTSSGIGKKTFSTTAPAAGMETSIVATISLPDGPMDTRITIKPSVMVLLWQATDSHVPPFYKGKALPTPDSEVKVVAMPEVRSGSGAVPSENMTYNWKKDYTNNVDGSGYGKNFFLYINDYLEDSNNISVVASTTDQTSSSQADITIPTVQPKILFYKYSSMLGTLWDMALTDNHKIQDKETVYATPYFISPKETQHPSLIWSWFINDTKVSLASIRNNLMPLQAESGKHGTSKLRLNIQNQDKIFQTTDKEINIEF